MGSTNGSEVDYCAVMRNKTFRANYRPPLENRASGAQAQIVIFYFLNTLLVLFVLVFAFYKYAHPSRAKFTRLRQRDLGFIILSHYGASLATVVGSWDQSHRPEESMPCLIFVAAYYTIVPALIFPLVSRLIKFYREAQWTNVVLTVAKTTKLGDADSAETRSFTGSEADSQTNASEATRIIRGIQLIWVTIKYFFFCQQQQQRRGTVASEHMSQANAKIDIHDKAALQFLKSNYGAICTLAVIFCPYTLSILLALALNPMVRAGCWGCTPTFTEEIVLMVLSIIAVILLVVAYRVSIIPHDPFGFVQEIRLAVWLGGIPAIIFIILNAGLKRYTLGNFQIMMISEFFLVIYCFFQSAFQCIQCQLEISQSITQQVSFNIKEFEKEFLHKNGTFAEAFGRHLASEHGYESMAFLTAIFEWERVFFDINPKAAKARARKITRTYVGENAELSCNLSETCAKYMRSVLDKPDEDLKFDFFQMAKSEIITMLYGDSFRRFLRSDEYRALSSNAQNEITPYASRV